MTAASCERQSLLHRRDVASSIAARLVARLHGVVAGAVTLGAWVVLAPFVLASAIDWLAPIVH